MFHHDRYMHHYTPSTVESAEYTRIYNESRSQLEADIEEQRIRLATWLENNTSVVHHSLVQAIYNDNFPVDRESEDISLEFYRGKLHDMRAVNVALHGGGTDDLEARAAANMESRSVGLMITGISFLVLSAALILGGLLTLNPLLMYLGVMSVLASFGFCLVGEEKVSTTKSTLFADLKEKISPTPPLRYYLREADFMDYNDLHYVPSVYDRHML